MCSKIRGSTNKNNKTFRQKKNRFRMNHSETYFRFLINNRIQETINISKEKQQILQLSKYEAEAQLIQT